MEQHRGRQELVAQTQYMEPPFPKIPPLPGRLSDSLHPVHCNMGSVIPRECAVAIASGYPASACRATPIPGSHVNTRSNLSSASVEPSATITMPACSE